jgi:hypothetical protein
MNKVTNKLNLSKITVLLEGEHAKIGLIEVTTLYFATYIICTVLAL